MYALFQMEEKLDLKILKREGCYCLQFGDGRFDGMNRYLSKWYEVRRALDGCYCLQFGDGRFDGMNRYLSKWYEVRRALDEAMPDLTDEERKKKIFDYNMFEWTYPSGIAINSRRKYDEHPINRMQEIQEEKERSEALMKKLDQYISDSEE